MKGSGSLIIVAVAAITLSICAQTGSPALSGIEQLIQAAEAGDSRAQNKLGLRARRRLSPRGIFRQVVRRTPG